MSRFHYSLRTVLALEGGYVDHPADPGGKTNHGVTQETYSNWLESIGAPNRSVREITDDEVEAIYLQYWKDAHGDRMPEPLDLLVFDCAINSGAGRAIKLLQRVLGIDEDGIFGKQTITALHEDVVAYGIEYLCYQYIEMRRAWYHDIVLRKPDKHVFLKGWLNRLDHLAEAIA